MMQFDNMYFWPVITVLSVWLITCCKEKERHAVGRACLLLLIYLFLHICIQWLKNPLIDSVWTGIHIPMLLTILICLVPFTKSGVSTITGDTKRVDERDAFFHRFYRLQPGSPEFETHYKTHPDQRKPDDKIRNLPDLGEPGTLTYHEETAPFFRSIYDTLDPLTQNQDIPTSYPKITITQDRASRRIKGFANRLGADLVGITELRPEWIYSHIGRGEGDWGAPIRLNHTHAIAVAVEMDHAMIRHAPGLPTITESTRIYLDTARIAISLAHYIRRLGYQARAHVDGNYRVLCIPIAVDAGLGELGRHGLLITPGFGSRVRLAVVTTDLPLQPDKPVAFGVREFCRICRKCAVNCPSGSIANGDPRPVNGVEKWQSGQTSCYHYWRRQGTDCALCIRVCPYSHPDTLMHKLVRYAIRRNPIARMLAVKMDDFFYGRKPDRYGRFPEWHAST